MANRKKIVGTMITVQVDGAFSERAVEVKDVASAVHSALDDFFEMVPYFSQYKGRRCAAFVGENGKRKGLPGNRVATEMWRLEFPPPHNQDYIAGPMVIVYGDERFMEEL